MKLLRLLVPVAAIALVFYAGSNYLLGSFSGKLGEYIRAYAARYSVQVDNLDYAGVRVSGMDSVGWEGISANVRMPSPAKTRQAESFSISADEAVLRAENPFRKEFVLELKDVNMVFMPIIDRGSLTRREEMSRLEGDFVYKFRFDFLRPRLYGAQIKENADRIEQFIRQGKSPADLSFSGKVYVFVKGAPALVRIYTVRENQVTRIEADKQDLRTISLRFQDKLTDAEIEFLSKHPVYAPILLAITDYAVTTTQKEKKKDKTLNSDAFRHVLWSFLLTRSFGPDFAKQVTDAHEEGDSSETEADHQMDFNNNAVGRGYALSGIAESSILERVKTDPKIVRSVRQLR